MPRSATDGRTRLSPSRSGMSRYPKWKSPEKATSSCSLTPREPSGWTSTATSAERSEKSSACAAPGKANATTTTSAIRRMRIRHGPAATAAGFRDLRATGICASRFRACATSSQMRKPLRRGREAAAFRDLRATGICASRFRACATRSRRPAPPVAPPPRPRRTPGWRSRRGRQARLPGTSGPRCCTSAPRRCRPGG
jgi:hypothetical protein